MMIHELKQPIYVITELGKGIALFIIDYGINLNTCWVVCLIDGGRIKHFDSNQIIIEENHTYGIKNDKTNDKIKTQPLYRW